MASCSFPAAPNSCLRRSSGCTYSASNIPYPFPYLAAYVAGIAEIVLPILLVLGLCTRFAALGILVMTAIIQLTVPEGWANFHLPWAAMALTLVVFGGGKIALDTLLARLWSRE